MNQLIQLYRGQNPTVQISDDEIMDMFAEDHPPEVLQQYPDFIADYQKLQTTRAVRGSSVSEEFGKGFRQGMAGLKASGAGALAILSDTFGAGGARDYYAEAYKNAEGEMQKNASSVPRLEDIQGVKSGFQYLSGKVGSLVPAVGEAAVMAGIGTMAAPGPGTEAGAVAGLVAKGAARSALKRTMEKRMTPAIRGEIEDYVAGKIAGKELTKEAAAIVSDISAYQAGIAASVIDQTTQSAGGAYGHAINTEGVTDKAALEAAAIAGAGGSIAALLPARVLKGLFGEKIGAEAAASYVDLYAKKIPAEIMMAGGGMGAMEFFNILAEKHADPKKRDEDFTKEDYSRLLNSIAVGLMASAPAVGISAIRGISPEEAGKNTSAEGVVPPGATGEAEAAAASPTPPAPPVAPPEPPEIDIGPVATGVSGAVAESRRLLQEARGKAYAELQRKKKKEDRPEVPATPAEEQVDVVTEIRKKEAKTVRQIQDLFPDSKLSREKARELRNAAWGAPVMSAKEAESLYPVELSKNTEFNLRVIARDELAGRELDSFQVEYLNGLPEPVQVRYRLIKEEEAAKTPKPQADEAAPEPPEAAIPATPVSPSDPLQAAAVELSPEAKAAFENAGVTVEAVVVPKEPEAPAPPAPAAAAAAAVHDEVARAKALALSDEANPEAMSPGERSLSGWIEVWRQDRSDAPTEGFRANSHWGTREQAEAIRQREIEAGRTPGKLHHAFIRVTNPLETYDGGFWEKPIAEAKAKGNDAVSYNNEGEGVGGKSYIPLSKDQIHILRDKPAAESEVPTKAADVQVPPTPAAKVEAVGAPSLLDRVKNAISAWKTPRTEKVEEEFYTDIGRDASDKSKSKALGVFELPDGRIVAATIYDNRGRKVYMKGGGYSWDRIIKSGAKPIGHIRTEEAQKGFFQEFTPAEWAPIQAQLEEKARAAREVVVPISEEVAGTKATATGEVTQEGQRVSEKPNQYIPQDATRQISADDVDTIHREMIKSAGGIPGPETARDNLAELLQTNLPLVKRIAEAGGDRASDLLLHLLDAYEETAREFSERGRGTPDEFRSEFAKKLADFYAEKPTKRDAPGEDLSGSVLQSRPAERSTEPGRPELASVGQHVLQRLARLGIPVEVVTTKLGPLLDGLTQSMGSYDRAKKAITWVLSDLTRPTSADVRILFEEAGHALFDRESPEMREPILRAISQLANRTPEEFATILRDIAHAYPEGMRPEVMQEELLMGWISHKLSREGFNPVQSRGIAQAVVRLVKELYLKASMWVQQNLLGQQYDNHDLALRYFQNRLEGFLAGDQETMSWVDRLGAAKAPFDQQIQWHQPTAGSKETLQSYNTVTGQIDTESIVPDSVQAVLLNLRGDDQRYSIPAPGAPAEPYVDPAVKLNRMEAVNNEVIETRELAAAAAGIDAERLRVLNGLSSTKKIAEVLANEATLKEAERFVRGQRLAGFANEQNSGPGYRDAAARLTSEQSTIAKHIVKDKETKASKEEALEKLQRRAPELQDRYKDATFMESEIQKGVRALTIDDIKRIAQGSRGLGVILQQAKNLEGKIDQSVDPAVVSALRKLFTGTELSGQNLFELLDIMANDEAIDFSRPAAEIRATIRQRAEMMPDYNPYQRLVSNSPEGRALLSTVIGYGKLNTKTMTHLQMRRMESGERRAALEQDLKNAWKETREQITRGIQRVAKSASIEQVARAEYRRTMGMILKAKKDIEHLDTRINVNERALPEYAKKLDQITGKISITEDSVFGDGMIVRVPAVAGEMNPKWNEEKINLNANRGPVTTPDQILGYAAKIAEFTKLREDAAVAGDSTAMGAEYQRAKRQLNEIIRNRFFDPAVRNTDATATGLFMSSARTQMGKIGLPTGSALEVALGKWVNDSQVIRQQADREFGHKNPRLKSELLGIVNEGRKRGDRVSPEWFTKYLLNSVFGFMEKMQPTEGGDRPADVAASFEKLGNWLLKHKDLSPLIADRMPAFMAKLRDLVDTRYESGQYFTRKNIEAGLLVEDPKLGGLLRQAFKVGLYTFPRKFSDTFSNMVHSLRQSGWKTTGKDDGVYGDFKLIAEAYARNPDDARALIAKYTDNPIYGDAVRNDFLFKLTHVPDESTIQTPVIDDAGTRIDADAAAVARFYDESGGDLVGMFEKLHDHYNGREAIGDYIQNGMLDMVGQFAAADSALAKIEPKGDVNVASLENLIPNAMIDARQFTHWPSEWFDYHEFDRNDNARMAERISGQMNFGRDTKVLAGLHKTLNEETNALVAKLEAVMTQAERNVPSGKRAAIRAAAEKILDSDKSPTLAKLKDGKERLQFLQRMEKRQPLVQKFVQDMATLFNRGNQAEGSLKWGIRLSQELASLMVNQPTSAISQLATMFDIPVQWGASSTMLGRTLRTVQLTAKDIAGSLAQGIGWKFLQTSYYEDRLNKLGLNDPDAARKFGDFRSTLEGEQHNPWARRFRQAKDLQSATLNLVGDQANYTPLRPLAPFTQFVHSANRALTISLWELADNYVSKGVQFLKTHPGKDKITAEDLGMRGLEKDSFERWQKSIASYGMDFTEMANGASKRLATGDKTVLTDTDLSRLYSLGLNEISQEANIATMPMWAFNNSVLRFGLPLLGWSYRRALQVAGMRLDAADKNSLKAVGTGMLGLAVSGLGGLGLSLVVDQYQEDVLGKKRNLRGTKIPETAQDWLGLQERIARIGTLGMWGELANSAINVGTGQGDNRMLSADQRVIAMQSFQTLQRAISSYINQGFEADYQHVVRPAMAALGGNGMLQYMQLVNRAFDLDNAESRVVKRINAQNYLRVVGRELGMSVKASRSGYDTPTPITPWVARMEFAAYANDPNDFREAYRGALTAAKAADKEDAPDYVKKSFEGRHPLRYIFSPVPTEREYQRLLGEMSDQGSEAVRESINLFNYYGSHLGATPFQGSTKKASKPNSAAAAKARALAGGY